MNDDVEDDDSAEQSFGDRDRNRRTHPVWRQWAKTWSNNSYLTTRRQSVVIIGGGITGLSAAHELAERGFSVVVVEKEVRKGEADIGGVARSQWPGLCLYRVPTVEESFELAPPTDWMPIHYTNVGDALRGDVVIRLTADAVTNIVQHIERSFTAEPERKAGTIALRSGKRSHDVDLEDGQLAATVFDFFGEHHLNAEIQAAQEDLAKFVSKLNHALERLIDPAVTKARVELPGAPGEHGFRFFPSFYRNLFDTMRRIPVYPRDTKDRRGHDPIRTVFDNLVPMNNVLVALGDGEPPLRLLRHAPQSLEELWTMADDTFRRLGFDAQDSVRYQVEMFRWMTSCSGRRAEWAGDFPADHWPAIEQRPSTDEQKAVRGTWWDHINASSRYSRGFKEQIRASSMALVGMKAREIDARTYGNVAVQMLLDQVGYANRADFTLNGPTSEAWFDPWKAYLKDIGVVFMSGTMTSIKADGDGWKPVWGGGDPTFDDNPPVHMDENIRKALNGGADYFVLAVALPQIFDLLKASGDPRVLPTTLHEIARWKRVATKVPEPATDPVDGPTELDCEAPKEEPWYTPKRLTGPMPFRNMSGVQYFFRTHLHIERGHYYLPRSDWSLSALSQGPQWRKQNDKTVRGVLSVDISDFTKPDARTNRAAWQVGREELVITTWAQIMRARGSWDGPLQLPRYDHAHVDKYLEYDAQGKRLLANKAPYLINLPGQWKLRAPVTDPPEDRTAAAEKLRYRVESGWVVAGPHMKTYTRLATMEAANESARHAVNAILRDVREDVDEADTPGRTAYGYFPGRRYALCPIANLEEHEVPDLNVFKDVDARLYERGLPHMFDILEVRELVDGALGSKGPAAAFGAMEDAVLDRLGLTRVRAGSAARPMQAVLDLVRQGLSKLVK